MVLLCSLVFMSLTLPVLAQSTSWTASNFEVFFIDPWVVVPKQNNGAYPAPAPVPTFKEIKDYIEKLGAIGSQVGLMEGMASITKGHLKEAGNIYEGIGLPEPIFGPIKGSTRGVFLFPFPGLNLPTSTADGIASFIPGQPCNSSLFKDNWIALNANTNLTNRLLQYKSIAHELFHAIQHQSLFKKGLCSVEKWIHEGTADAAGFFLMEKKSREDNLSIPATLKNEKFYGIRPYDVPLDEDTSWNIPEVKARFGQKIQGYNTLEINSYFGYRTSSFWRYLMDRYDLTMQAYDPRRLLALSTSVLNRPYTSNTLWLDWVAEGVEDNFGAFQHAYGEFLAEFAAWPGSKYKQLSFNDVELKGFGGCEPVVLSYANQSTKEIILKPHTGSNFAFYPISGRCIQVTVNDVKGKKVKLQLEAHASSSDIAEQLVLGFAREEHEERGRNQASPYRNTVLEDDCYSYARTKPKDIFPCLFYGKVKERKGEQPTTGIRTWRFEARKAKHSTLITTFILTNVDPITAGNTKEIKELKVFIGFPKSTGKTRKGAQLGIPETFNLGELPDMTIPRRQALYGIKKKSAISTGYSMNLGPIQVAALDDAGNKTETYAITPLESVAFGQTGPFKAMVMVGNQGAQSGLSTRIIGSTYCATDSQLGSIGTITRSDDEILEIAIDTPLCQLSTFDIMACEDGCPIVDHFQGTISLPFGWRYFAENEVEDLVTPGVLLDIDRYHHEVFGTPLQGLSGSGSGESGSGGGDAAGGSGSGNTGGSGAGQGGTMSMPPCDCSCEAYEKLKKAKHAKPPDFTFLGQMMQCAQQCAKPFRDCRRAQKQR